jgi:hypothetical protein
VKGKSWRCAQSARQPEVGAPAADEHFILDDNRYIADVLADFRGARGRDYQARILFKKRMFRETDETITEPQFVTLSYVQARSDAPRLHSPILPLGCIHMHVPPRMHAACMLSIGRWKTAVEHASSQAHSNDAMRHQARCRVRRREKTSGISIRLTHVRACGVA